MVKKKPGVANTPHIIKNILHPSRNIFFNIPCKKNLYSNLDHLYKINNSIPTPKINIGGDHSMALGTVVSSLCRYPNMKLIWIDAHPDINTYEKSASGNFHGMPLSFLTNLENQKKFPFIQNYLPFKNILYIGIRDIDPFEKEIIEKYNINLLTVSEIQNSLSSSLKKITSFIDNSPIHISLDVDGLDPSIIPCTGTPVKGGFNLSEILDIISILKRENIINMDFAELNLELGNQSEKIKSLDNSLTILNEFVQLNT